MAPQSQKNGPIIEPSYMTAAAGEGDTAASATTALARASSLPAESSMPPPIAVINPAPSAPHSASALAGAVTVGGQAIITSPPAAALTAAAAAVVVAAAAPTPTRDTPLLLSGSAGGVSRSPKTSSASSPPKMLFSDLYRSTKSPLSRLRPQSTAPIPGADFDADLVSKDKVKNKEAVKRYLADRIRNDWEFKWPRPGQATQTNDLQDVTEIAEPTVAASTEDIKTQDKEDAPEVSSPDSQDLGVEELDGEEDSDDDTASVYSTVSEDTAHFRPRLDWWSDFSDDDSPALPSAYRFDTPDAVGPIVQASADAKRARRRRAIREEETWNGGLACFNARRDAWTGAKIARVKPKPPATPTTPSSASRRMSFFRLVSTSPPVSPGLPLSPTATRTSGDTTAVTSDGDSKEGTGTDSSQYPVEILLPLAPPLLPPANPMRASITPATYPNLYDRIIVHSLTPSCPVNLADVLRSCVVGWKRDGEWPPRPADAPVPVVAVRKKKPATPANQTRRPSTARRMSLGFLGRRDSAAAEAQAAEAVHDDGNSGAKGIRKSIQRVLGFGHERSGSTASNNAVA